MAHLEEEEVAGLHLCEDFGPAAFVDVGARGAAGHGSVGDVDAGGVEEVSEVIAPAEVGAVAGGGVADDEDGRERGVEGRVGGEVGLDGGFGRRAWVWLRGLRECERSACGNGDEEAGQAARHGDKGSIGAVLRVRTKIEWACSMEALVKRFGLVVALGLVALCAVAQEAGSWTVKPEWVKAHEEVLAGDAMRGRGSATTDEERAAEYVVKEFAEYGLKPAPKMSGYIQSAELVSPQLDGHATLTVGGMVLHEGVDFVLLASPGVNASGALMKLRPADVNFPNSLAGAAALLTDIPTGTSEVGVAGSFRQNPPALIMMLQNGETDRMYMMMGGKTRVPIREKGAPEPEKPMMTMIALTPAVMAKVATAKGEVALAVHVIPRTGPRMTYNAIGYLPGSDDKAGTILLTAHLDHLGVGTPINGDGIWNGANDDASGTTAVLELAHALAAGPKLKRSVLFVCYGSEELGELGSTYFGENPPVPLKSLVANLEFEMIGAQDPKLPKGVLLFTGWERSNLGPTLKEHGALVGPDPYPEEHFFERSDNYALAKKGVVAHTAAGWGTVPTYHQPDDDMEHLDIPFMTAAIQSLVEPVRWLADSDFVPKWNHGGKP